MGSELVSDSACPDDDGGRQKSAPVSYTEIFYQHLPYYLAMGVTWEQFWNEDCTIVKYYREAQKIKRKIDNEKLWLQGMYIYEVLCDVNPIYQAFPKRGAKPTPYSKEPYALTQEDVEQREERAAKAKYEKMKAQMREFAASFNKRRKEVERTDG